MAFFSYNNIRIAGISASVPKKVRYIRDMDCFAPGEAEKVIALTHVEEARIAPEGMCASDLCYEAAEKLISDLHWDKKEIEVLVFVSFSRAYYVEPNTAGILQNRLGLPTSCMALDIPFPCAGYLYGMNVVASLLEKGTVKKALLLNGETCTRNHSLQDKELGPLLGDAGSATAIEFCEGADPIQINLYTDGSGADWLAADEGGCRHPATPDSFKMIEERPGIIRNKLHVRMRDGMSVFSFSTTEPVIGVKDLCSRHNIDMSSIDYLYLHQANKMICDRIARKFGVPLEKVPYSLMKFGNPASVSVPLTMVYATREALSTKPVNAMLCAFGGGLAWGSAHIMFDKIVCPELIEVG